MENTEQNGAPKEEHEANAGQRLKQKVKSKEDKVRSKGKKPAGGYDTTPVPKAPAGYTVRFTFHRATNLPFADFNTLSSDPYVLAQLNTGLPTRHPEDSPLRYRTQTIRRSTDPEWESSWVVANVPARGFKLKVRVYDEDPADHDDRLGNVHVHANNINESWPGIHDQSYGIAKRMGSKRAYLVRGIAVLFSKTRHMNGYIFISAEVLGRSPGPGGRAYTIGPQDWTRHFSPLIGRIAGTKEPGKEGQTEKYNFQSYQLQLRGPVPEQMYHRYVEFKSFIKGMFSKAGLRGRVLNRALHHQHARVYNFDRDTEYGSFQEPSEEITRLFLDMVHHGEGGRMFTYVLTLDARFRFTETGKEFGIDLLSKHTMHSDVSAYIAFSGEFLVRKIGARHQQEGQERQASPGKEANMNGISVEHGAPDVSNFELVIDNDSGTYRPNGELLPLLKEFFEANFVGLRVRAMACDDDDLSHLKDEQRERKRSEGNTRRYVQTSSAGSVSSSDVEELDRENGDTGQSSSHKPNVVSKGEQKMHSPEDKVKQWVVKAA